MAKTYMDEEWFQEAPRTDVSGRLIIDVTKEPRVMDGPPAGMAIAGEGPRPIVEGATIDMAMMGPESMNPGGQYRSYEAYSPRPVGVSPGGERTVVTSQGANILEGADRRLTQGGYGGVMVRDGVMTGTQGGNRESVVMQPEGFAPIRTNDQRIAMSPEALGALGNRQIMEEQAALPRSSPVPLSLRKELQAQADRGFLPAGTDARNREIMRGTEARNNQLMLERSRPRDMMDRINQRDRVMSGAEASLMTPQVQTQDGVMAGWDPVQRKIVSDSSGAKAIAAAKVPDKTLGGEDDKTILEQVGKLNQRKNGKLDENQAIIYSQYMKTNPAQAEQYKRSIVGVWTPEDEQILNQYLDEGTRRGVITRQQQGGGGAGAGAKRGLWKPSK